MQTALAFNPGSNSIRFDLVELPAHQTRAGEGKKIFSALIENLSDHAALKIFNPVSGEVTHTESHAIPNIAGAAHFALDLLRRQQPGRLDQITFAGVRVVHGGSLYTGAARVDARVLRDIESLEELAPLHNRSSLEILHALAEALPDIPAFVTFDTAFHLTLPETAWRYPIERETADRQGIRKFGFHGLSHRYMLEQYAHTVGKRPADVTLVTLHLESGSSAAAIRNGQSVDTTMGFTPLEGLMMGSRSGSIDPAILPFLMRKEDKSAEDILTLLNKHSGLLGIAGGSLDTRELVKREDPWARLALEMFGYRVRLAVGAYLAALGDAEAVIFGGGIGEDSPWLRTQVCAGLTGWGLELDSALNDRSIEGQVHLSKPSGRLQAWSMPVEEALQLAFECRLARDESR
jgi:acetate kinase